MAGWSFPLMPRLACCRNWRQIGHFMSNLEIIRQPARFFNRTLQEGLLIRCHRNCGLI
jgi:hypothetical protein